MKSKRTDIESDFYMFAKMVGLNQRKRGRFDFDGEKFKVNVLMTPEIAEVLGGRNRAFRLLRHARAVQMICCQEDNRHLFGTISKSFDKVCELHPYLRSYYEGARVGGAAMTWVE